MDEQPPPPSAADSHPRVFLTGYRGTGKSTVGRIVAERLGWSALDADDEIEAAAGRTIAAIFADDGEPAFRDLEERVVTDLCARVRVVVALGGGAILRPTTRARLVQAGPVAWLTAPAATLAARIAADDGSASRRPRLTDLAAADEVQRLMAEREPFYRECATFAVSTEGRPPAEVADEVVRRLRRV